MQPSISRKCRLATVELRFALFEPSSKWHVCASMHAASRISNVSVLTELIFLSLYLSLSLSLYLSLSLSLDSRHECCVLCAQQVSSIDMNSSPLDNRQSTSASFLNRHEFMSSRQSTIDINVVGFIGSNRFLLICSRILSICRLH